MSRFSKKYLTFEDRLNEVLNSGGKLCLPNVEPLEDHTQALLNIVIMRKRPEKEPYNFLIRTFDPPIEFHPGNFQTREVCYYPKIFLNTRGMGGSFDGSGMIITANNGKPKVFTFFMCEHVWDTSGSNHSRGWHPQVCTKCGFDASIDSGD